MVTHLPPTSKVNGSNPRPYVGKLVVAYRWSAVYSTVHTTVCAGFLCPQNYSLGYDLYSVESDVKTANKYLNRHNSVEFTFGYDTFLTQQRAIHVYRTALQICLKNLPRALMSSTKVYTVEKSEGRWIYEVASSSTCTTRSLFGGHHP